MDEQSGVIEWLSDDPEERRLQLAEGFEPELLRDQGEPGTAEASIGKWISPKKRG